MQGYLINLLYKFHLNIIEMFEELMDQQDLSKKQAKLFEQKKKFKNLESDKKAYIEETVKVIKKQKTTIDKLKKENEALKDLIV